MINLGNLVNVVLYLKANHTIHYAQFAQLFCRALLRLKDNVSL